MQQRALVSRRACLALLAAVLALMAQESEAFGTKEFQCCTQVSMTEVKDPIFRYSVQWMNTPCVRAVIFHTATGAHCVYWKLAWVKAKIKELNAAKKNATSVLPTNQISRLILPDNRPVQNHKLKQINV